LPDGVTLRPINPEHYRGLYAVWKNAFSETWTSKAESEEDFQEFVAENLAASTFDAALCHVAWVGDEVVGFVFARLQKGVGAISEVAVHKSWQRRGIARGLMNYALNALHDRGIRQVRLFTNAEDEKGARSLYEALGFREVKQHIFYRKALDA
jgi:mycothiol synthase